MLISKGTHISDIRASVEIIQLIMNISTLISKYIVSKLLNDPQQMLPSKQGIVNPITVELMIIIAIEANVDIILNKIKGININVVAINTCGTPDL